MRTCTSRNSIARTNQEFERYANVEILEFVKIEVAVFMMGPNEESTEHSQARGSMPCGCASESRCRRWLSRMRAWKEEYDVCSSLPQSLSAAESEFVEFARSENMMINLMKVLRNVFVVQTTVPRGCHKAMWSGTSSIFAVRGALVTRTCEFLM